MRKPVFRRAVVTLSSLALLAAACGDDDDGEGRSDAPSDTAPSSADDEELTGTLSVVGSPGRTAGGGFLEIAAEAFQTEHPDVEITIESMELSQMDQVLPAQINAGTAPDIISTTTAYGSPVTAFVLAESDLLVDLREEPWVQSLPEAILDQISLDDHVWSFPTDTVMFSMHYRPSVLEAEGLEVPETFDQLLEICETASERGVVGVALSAGEPFTHITFLLYDMLGAVYADDPDFTERHRAGETTFADSAGWLTILEQVEDMNEAECFGPSPLAVSRDAAEQQFATGQSYLMGGYSVGHARLEEIDPAIDAELFPMPTNDPEARRVSVGPVIGLVVPKSGDNVELAKAFLNFVAENTSQFVEEAEGHVVPAVVDPDSPPPLPDYLSEMETLIEEGLVVEVYPDLWPYPDVYTAFVEGAASVVQGTMEPSEVLDAMDAAWQAGE